jgi:hypothetical protein
LGWHAARHGGQLHVPGGCRFIPHYELPCSRERPFCDCAERNRRWLNRKRRAHGCVGLELPGSGRERFTGSARDNDIAVGSVYDGGFQL